MKPYEAFFHLFFQDLEPGDFPFRFTVEVTNHCNLRCTTCPREASGRGYGYMERELFVSLAREAAGRSVLFYPQGLGESFLHPEYRDMLRALEDIGVRYPVCITNGTFLDEENCRALVDAAPRVVIVSLDGGSKEVFEAIRRNADYDRVVENVQRLFRVRDDQRARHPHIILSVVGAERVQPTLEEFRAEWEPYLRRSDEIFVCSPVSWAGTWDHPDTRRPPEAPAPPPVAPGQPRPPCRMLYKTLTVFYDGRATPCCYDHACALEVGNAREETVEEIWGGERLHELRRLHEEGRVDEIPLCRDCPDFVP